MKQNILIAGVGGQGNLFASALLAKSAIRRGYQVLATETIGAAQRGGSVVSHLRIADHALYSPLIPDSQADYLVGFEPVELLRQIRKLKQNGWYILNTHPVLTIGCTMGIDHYPTLTEINSALKEINARGHVIQATEAADEIGDPLLMNMVMLGALCTVSEFFELDEIKILVAEGPRKALVEANLDALDAGAMLIHQVAL
jgi:indolepyruvate ferredoxin oxidoreductase, beta subunit